MDGKGKAKESTRTRSDWNAKIGANSPANRRQTAATRDTKEALMADDSIVCCENRFESWNGTRLSTIDNELSASHQRQVPFFFFWSLLLLFRSFRSFPSRSCVLHRFIVPRHRRSEDKLIQNGQVCRHYLECISEKKRPVLDDLSVFVVVTSIGSNSLTSSQPNGSL